ncbi:MAG TPA: hypothetical protein VKQ30_04810 [Ktedonobacterales bacterium]|nr:hypothetical protein [Ktedonobacterales bacterium]
MSIVAAAVLVGSTFIACGGAVAHAAPAPRAIETTPAFGIPHETSKVTLHETSIDGPAFWSQESDGAPVGPLTVLAWTGTDRRLNFIYSNNGTAFFGKVTLNETSIARPAVARGPGADGQASTAPVALAWTGTDPGRHLNVLYRLANGTTMKLTVPNNNSFTAPALGWLSQDTINKTLLLGWAGTDEGHSLNLMPISITSDGLVAGTKSIFFGFHSFGPPQLGVAVPQGSLASAFDVLSWSDLATHRLAWALSPDGKTWTQKPMFPEASAAGPGMKGALPVHIPQYWTAWTGLDPAHHVNVLYAVNFDAWSTNFVKGTLPETAVGGSQVGFIFGDTILVAWTGTDSLHHLNMAMIGV